MNEKKERRTYADGKRAYGSGSVIKRGRFWYIRWRDATGRRRTEATKTTNRSEAEKILRDRIGQADRGENPDAGKMSFEELTKLYLDDRKVKGTYSKPPLKHLKLAFNGKRVRAIHAMAVTAYERARLDAGAARATVNNEIATLRRMFNVAVERGMLTIAHVPKIKTPDPRNARKGFFEAEDFEAIVKELDADLQPPMRFAYLTGWRKGELISLQWRQVDFDAEVIRLEPNTTKNHEGREFPFGTYPPLKALLLAQRERTREVEKRKGAIIPWVFHRDGRQIISYDRAWRAARERAATEERDGLRVVVRPHLLDRRVHDFRRTAVRNLERAGVSRTWAMKLTGHKTESTYRRYAISDKKALEEAVTKLANFRAQVGEGG